MATIAPTATTPSSFATLPTELAELIFGKLDRRSLIACAKTNKAWNTLSTPCLWRTIDINNPQQLESFLTTESQAAFYRNAKHIRDLSLNYGSIYSIFSPPTDNGSLGSNSTHGLECTGLRRLNVYKYRDPKRQQNGEWITKNVHSTKLSPAMEDTVGTLIRQNPGLKELKIGVLMSTEMLVPLLTHDLPSLQIFSCHFQPCFDRYIGKVILDHLPESIRSIDICVAAQNQAENQKKVADAIRDRLGLLQPRQHNALESLAINSGSRRTSPEDEHFLLLPFLNTCSRKLKYVSINGVEGSSHISVRRALSRVGFALRSIVGIELSSESRDSDAKIAEYIRLSTQWKIMDLGYCRHIGPLAVRAILDNCDHVEFLKLNGCNRVSSADLQSILSHAVLLKTFEGLEARGHIFAGDPFMSAHDLIALNWGSLSLKTFRCQIKVPRSDDHSGEVEEEEGFSRQSGAAAASLAVQRQVYRKLAEQTHLKELQLGHHPSPSSVLNERRYQEQCLELTLESGLDELACLQQLEVLIIGHIAHRIGVAELRWMNKNWPKLRSVVGLFDNRANHERGIREWIRDHRLFWAYS